MTWKLFRLLFIVALLSYARLAPAALEVSLTVSGDIHEIQALLDVIEQRNQQAAQGDSPLKINLHSTTQGALRTHRREATPAPRPAKLFAPQLPDEKLIPGKPALVTVAVRDDRNEVDTLAIQVVGTNLNTDLYDDGTHGDVKARDGVWSVTLTPMETTPAGHYALIVTAFDRNGQTLRVPDSDGVKQPLQVHTEISIER